MNLGISAVRLSFAGGGTDLPEYYNDFGGNVIASTINHFTYVMSNKRTDGKFQIFSPEFHAYIKPIPYDKLTCNTKGTELASSTIKHLNSKDGIDLMLASDVEPASGLGSSSALTVNLVNTVTTLNNKNLTKNELAENAHYIQRHFLNWPMGKQDEYISAFGGFNFIKFKKDEIKIIPIKLTKLNKKELENNLMLFYVGGGTHAGILPNQVEQIKKNNQKVMSSLHQVKELAESMYQALKKSDITKFGELLHLGWTEKKKFSRNVTNTRIDRLYNKLIDTGAVGGKITGAGGGGHMLIYCEQSSKNKILEEAKNLKLKYIPFKFYSEGAKMVRLYDYKY